MPEQELHYTKLKAPICFVSVLSVRASGSEEVVEAGAVRYLDGQKQDAFVRLASVSASLPLAFQKLTGLEDARLRSHPRGDVLLRDLVEFVGSDRTVVLNEDRFNAHFEEIFIRPRGRMLDLGLLGRIMMPTLEDYSLAGLVEALGLEPPQKQRALSDAFLIARIWDTLLGRMADMPPIVTWEITQLLQAGDNPLLEFFNTTLDAPGGFMETSQRDFDFSGLFHSNAELLKEARAKSDDEVTNTPLPVEKICGMFEPEGDIGQNLAGYEKRDEQQHMVQCVCEALNKARHLMVEAGTGTGKSMAYLVPAIAWSMLNNDRVIVSTCTKNLQSQLFAKDVPFLQQIFRYPFRTALVKGRKNYLCVRKFLQLLEEHAREFASDGEYAAFLPVIYWAAQTETGDVAECNGLLVSPAWGLVWDRVSSTTSECGGMHCPYVTRCFLRKNRALAQLANIIIANHSVVFSSLGTENSLLSSYRCIVFDEAHNVEDVATDCLSRSLDRFRVYRIVSRLHRVRKGRDPVGLLSRVMRKAEDHLTVDSSLLAQLRSVYHGALDTLDVVQAALNRLLETCAFAFEDAPSYEDKRRFRDCGPAFAADGIITREALGFCAEVKRLAAALREMSELLEPANDVPDQAGLVRDVTSVLNDLDELVSDVNFIFAHDMEDQVYWIERTRRGRGQVNYSLSASPVNIGPWLSENFYPVMRTVVLCSATLAVGDDFSFMGERLGVNLLEAGRIETVNVGSPFDFESQCRLCVPTFLPDPGGKRNTEFDEKLSQFLTELLGVTEGRALVLFTAYSLLDTTYKAIKPQLEAQGIPVLAQGRDGTREAITNLFRKVRSSVLLGTQSFWEGVDVVGESLSCLVVTKLPFQVFTEPLIRARAEYLAANGKDPFRHYSLPSAVIRLRQGFGRLIRTKTDRGVVVITDRRLVEKNYGRFFLHSLPPAPRVFKRPEDLLRDVGIFLREAQTAAGNEKGPA